MFFKHHRKLVILFYFFNCTTRRRWLLCLETVTLWPSGHLSRSSLIPETEGEKKKQTNKNPLKIFLISTVIYKLVSLILWHMIHDQVWKAKLWGILLCIWVYACLSMCLCFWILLLRLICKWAVFNWLIEKQALKNQTILSATEIKLNGFQVHMNWEMFSIKLIHNINVCWCMCVGTYIDLLRHLW